MFYFPTLQDILGSLPPGEQVELIRELNGIGSPESIRPDDDAT